MDHSDLSKLLTDLEGLGIQLTQLEAELSKIRGEVAKLAWDNEFEFQKSFSIKKGGFLWEADYAPSSLARSL